ncbi:GNAT family N-acetyltransferase [Cellvibrio fontiphilus]|uniref:GNAT family N-acetyltransferase n=1 Tax=Cellvibrio fontiphilus TaxID=1815559 RepID=A0ABV7FCD4_9GAMM
MYIIRKANSADAAPLAELAEETFRATFGAMNSIENMDSHCQSSYGKEIQYGEIVDLNTVTLVVEENKRLIAYAQLRWDSVPDCVCGNAPGEIQRLYVSSAYHGKGIAKNLMEACMQELKGLGKNVIWLGVWELNPRAISFYKKSGFVEVGEHVFTLGDDPQRDVIMQCVI